MLNSEGHHFLATGCNIENTSYGLTLCAERVAIFKGVANGYNNLVAVAICCPSFQKGMNLSFTVPCGACRQVMTEFTIDGEIPIYIDNVDETFTLNKLLPVAFQLR